MVISEEDRFSLIRSDDAEALLRRVTVDMDKAWLVPFAHDMSDPHLPLRSELAALPRRLKPDSSSSLAKKMCRTARQLRQRYEQTGPGSRHRAR